MRASKSARMWLAGKLIRLAHRIHRPTVTEVGPTMMCIGMREELSAADRQELIERYRRRALLLHGMPPERRESRGWN